MSGHRAVDGSARVVELLAEIEAWRTAAPRVEMDDGGHFHEPTYPSCVVCRMRKLETALEWLLKQIPLPDETEAQRVNRVTQEVLSAHLDKLRAEARLL